MNFHSALASHQKEREEKKWFENCFEPVEKRSRAKDLTGYILGGMI